MAFSPTPPGIPVDAKSAPGLPPKKVAAKQKLSRAQTARRLYCSIMQVVRFEQLGKLKVEKVVASDGSVRVWYDVDEVAALCKEWQPKRGANKRKVSTAIVESNIRGKVAAKCFKLFRDGADLHDAVIATEADPILVRQVYEEYLLSLEAGLERKRVEAEERKDAALQREHMRDRRAAEARAHEEKLEKMRIAAAERLERERSR